MKKMFTPAVMISCSLLFTGSVAAMPSHNRHVMNHVNSTTMRISRDFQQRQISQMTTSGPRSVNRKAEDLTTLPAQTAAVQTGNPADSNRRETRSARTTPASSSSLAGWFKRKFGRNAEQQALAGTQTNMTDAPAAPVVTDPANRQPAMNNATLPSVAAAPVVPSTTQSPMDASQTIPASAGTDSMLQP